MLAARLYGREDLRIEDITEPHPGPGQVKLSVAHNGLCGTDLHEFFAGPLGCTITPHPLTGAVLPQIQGHEFSGVISEVGAGVDGLRVGDRVCVEPIYTCGTCDRCKTGLRNLCRMIGCHGLCADGGGLAQSTVVPSTMVHPLPNSVTLAQGALVEPMAVAFNGVLRSGIEPGQVGLIFGAGPIGIGAFLGMRALGVENVVVVEPAAKRRAAIEELGATDVIDPAKADVVGSVMRRTDSRGADAAIDCAGAAASFATATAVLRARSRYVVIAIFEQPVSFQPSSLLMGEAEMVGSMAYEPGVFDRVIGMMESGAYPTRGWVEHISFEDVVSEGLDPLRRGERIKVLVDLQPAA